MCKKETCKAKGSFKMMEAHPIVVKVRGASSVEGRRDKFKSLAEKGAKIRRRIKVSSEIMEGQFCRFQPVIHNRHSLKTERGIV